jgi:hypothetical protein
MNSRERREIAATKHNYIKDHSAAIREDRKRYPEKYRFSGRISSMTAYFLASTGLRL